MDLDPLPFTVARFLWLPGDVGVLEVTGDLAAPSWLVSPAQARLHIDGTTHACVLGTCADGPVGRRRTLWGLRFATPRGFDPAAATDFALELPTYPPVGLPAPELAVPEVAHHRVPRAVRTALVAASVATFTAGPATGMAAGQEGAPDDSACAAVLVPEPPCPPRATPAPPAPDPVPTPPAPAPAVPAPPTPPPAPVPAVPAPPTPPPAPAAPAPRPAPAAKPAPAPAPVDRPAAAPAPPAAPAPTPVAPSAPADVAPAPAAVVLASRPVMTVDAAADTVVLETGPTRRHRDRLPATRPDRDDDGPEGTADRGGDHRVKARRFPQPRRTRTTTRRTAPAHAQTHVHTGTGGLGAPDSIAGLVAGGATAFVLPSAADGGEPDIPAFLLPIYHKAARLYDIPWSILAAVNEIETDFGRNVAVSSAGAEGWMQFMPATWKAYGVDADDDGRRDPSDPEDAIHAAARYLKASGGRGDMRKALFAYNHANWYVEAVLLRAARISQTAGHSPNIDKLLEETDRRLRRRVVEDDRITIYACGRQDVLAKIVDRRVLLALLYLAESDLHPTVTSLRCGHGVYTASGNVSHHTTGDAVDIAAINGVPILGNQGPGSVTDIAVRQLLRLRGSLAPAQIITLMRYPDAPTTVAMGDHHDHIHLGFHPSPDR